MKIKTILLKVAVGDHLKLKSIEDALEEGLLRMDAPSMFLMQEQENRTVDCPDPTTEEDITAWYDRADAELEQ